MSMNNATMAKRAGSIAVAAALAIGVIGVAAAGPDQISVTGGAVSGIDVDGVRSYRGIPYAAPPVGALRWKAPQPVATWTGVRDGSQYGAECPQAQYPN